MVIKAIFSLTPRITSLKKMNYKKNELYKKLNCFPRPEDHSIVRSSKGVKRKVSKQASN